MNILGVFAPHTGPMPPNIYNWVCRDATRPCPVECAVGSRGDGMPASAGPITSRSNPVQRFQRKQLVRRLA